MSPWWYAGAMTLISMPTLLQLFDDFVARRTKHYDRDMSVLIDGRFGWATFGGSNYQLPGRVFYLLVPYARNWGSIYQFNSDTHAMGWRQCLITHTVGGRNADEAGWHMRWIPVPA